ncbi:MAG: GAF domain-containing protein [Chloroflexi bacterium]|nr:GAF domain-containing protein [Chloroflexota bacterium]
MADPTPSTPVTPSARVDGLLFQLRWIMALLVFPIAWIESGNRPLAPQLLTWFLIVVLINLIYGALLRFLPKFTKWLPVPSLVLDILLFGALPFLTDVNSLLLDSFAIFPALIGAIRFNPGIGFLIALILSVVLIVNNVLRGAINPSDLVSRALPIIALVGGVPIIGYLAKREKEAAISQATHELDELRGTIAGAKLLYQTSDLFTLTTNYRPVLEAMLEAGVKGLPEARREDGPAIGIAFFFDDQDPAKSLRVVAARNLDSADETRSVPGKTGIIGEALQTGQVSSTERVHIDPELTGFNALTHCRSAVCYPLQSGLEQYGVVVLASPAPRRPAPQHLELMRAFTSQAGIAFQNARLYQITRKEQNRIIHDDTKVRQKLARDLYDGPTQIVAGLVMQLEFIARLMDTNPGEAKQELARARATAEQTAKEIRTALFTLRPLALESKGLSAALEQYGERLRETEKARITIEPGNFSAELDTNTATTIFAIIEEAIGNARKHTENAPIHVRVTRQTNTLVATIQDQGPGFDLDQVSRGYDHRTSLGLQNMRERALLINGDLRIDSAPGHGTRITLITPLPAASALTRAP